MNISCSFLQVRVFPLTAASSTRAPLPWCAAPRVATGAATPTTTSPGRLPSGCGASPPPPDASSGSGLTATDSCSASTCPRTPGWPSGGSAPTGPTVAAAAAAGNGSGVTAGPREWAKAWQGPPDADRELYQFKYLLYVYDNSTVYCKQDWAKRHYYYVYVNYFRYLNVSKETSLSKGPVTPPQTLTRLSFPLSSSIH